MFSKLSPVEFEFEFDPDAVVLAEEELLFILAVTCCCGWSACRTIRGWNCGRTQDGTGDEEEKDEEWGSKSDTC